MDACNCCIIRRVQISVYIIMCARVQCKLACGMAVATAIVSHDDSC